MAFSSISSSRAMDIVDTYGPDRDLWPQEYVDAMDDAIASDADLADYIADTARIEAMLENWEDDDDGAHIDMSDLEPFEEEEEEGDIGAGAISTDGLENGSSGPANFFEEEKDDDAPEIVEIDMSDIQQTSDLDGALTDIIRKEIEFAGQGQDSWNVFTKDYDKILDVTPGSNTPIDALDAHVRSTTGPLQKELRRLIAARTMSKRLPGLRRGRIHSSSLHRILAGDDRVFFRREEAPALDTAVMLLIDCSGSMYGPRLKLATETGYALGNVFNRLGISFECLGFTTAHRTHPDSAIWSGKQYQEELEEASRSATIHRYEPIAIAGFKKFDERWTPEVQRRLAHTYNNNGGGIAGFEMGGTPESCSNEFAARRLLQRKEQRKIMITMTDGEPTICPYAANLGRYAARQRSAAVTKLIEGAGIDLIGIGIQHAAPQAYYANSMVINSLDEMPSQLLNLFKKLLVGK